MSTIYLTILGEPASKANSRELATIGPRDNRRTILRKSDKALNYEKDALRQIPPMARIQLSVPVRVTMRIYYTSERPDLDESVILDVLQNRYKGSGERRELIQKGVYVNDRQVREKHIFWGIDKANPRAEIIVEPLEAQQAALL
jgi:hypothetical protein